MNVIKFISLFGFSLFLCACNNENFSVIAKKTALSNFETSKDTAWAGAVAEYSASTPLDSIKLSVLIDTLPTGLDTTKFSLHVYSRNPGNNLFTYIKQQISGLTPGNTYNVVFEIDLATNYPQNTPAAASVLLKAGASLIEPVTGKDLKFNLSKGTGEADGTQMVSLGTISNGTNRSGYLIVKKENVNKPVSVVAGANGMIWLCVGLESGYKGPTDLYFDNIKATISQ